MPSNRQRRKPYVCVPEWNRQGCLGIVRGLNYGDLRGGNAGDTIAAYSLSNSQTGPNGPKGKENR